MLSTLQCTTILHCILLYKVKYFCICSIGSIGIVFLVLYSIAMEGAVVECKKYVFSDSIAILGKEGALVACIRKEYMYRVVYV